MLSMRDGALTLGLENLITGRVRRSNDGGDPINCSHKGHFTVREIFLDVRQSQHIWFFLILSSPSSHPCPMELLTFWPCVCLGFCACSYFCLELPSTLIPHPSISDQLPLVLLVSTTYQLLDNLFCSLPMSHEQNISLYFSSICYLHRVHPSLFIAYLHSFPSDDLHSLRIRR